MGQTERSESKRWTIYRPSNQEPSGFGEVWESATHADPELEPGEEVEVMPVAEHDAYRESAARILTRYEEALVEIERICSHVGGRSGASAKIAKEALDA